MDGTFDKIVDKKSVEDSPVSGSVRNSSIILSASKERIMSTKAIIKQRMVTGTDTRNIFFILFAWE